jgi:hypothetical protein
VLANPFRVLAVWVLVAVAAFMANGAIGGPTNDDFTIPGTESQSAFDLLDERFPAETGASSRIVFQADDAGACRPRRRGPPSTPRWPRCARPRTSST